jgi:hypothetical protein
VLTTLEESITFRENMNNLSVQEQAADSDSNSLCRDKGHRQVDVGSWREPSQPPSGRERILLYLACILDLGLLKHSAAHSQ